MFFNYLFILLSFLIILITGQNIFGGCGIRPPIQLPLPCPPPIIPIPCPPPSPCPPTFCPPPIVCPPPLPPLPCPPPLPPPPPCPLPLPCTCPPQQIGGIISPIGGGYPIGGYPSNDCCCQCNTPCRYMRRVKTHGSQIFAAPNEDQTEEDSTCNSIKLKKAIQENIINDDPNISKREIQKVAEKKLFTKINVICAKGEFSYLAYTDTFCQASYGNITCYAYRSLGLESNNNNKEIIKTTTTLNDIDLI